MIRETDPNENCFDENLFVNFIQISGIYGNQIALIVEIAFTQIHSQSLLT